MVKPSVVIDELDKLRRLIRQRPLITVVVCAVMALVLVAASWPSQSNTRRLGGSQEALIAISRPVAGSVVEDVEAIAGTVVGGPGFLYPLVTSLPTGVSYVAGPAVDVQEDGTWSGHARFGDINTPAGTKFQLQILRSSGQLLEGPFRGQAESPRPSEPINVERR